METLEAQLQELLMSYEEYFTVLDNGKIQCEVNGHTLPARLDVVSAFINGPKFQKLLKRHQAEHALKKYEPFIVHSINFPLMLYCALTGQLMDKSVEAVKKHMQGKKFQRAKVRFTNDELDLKPEPSLESFGIRIPKGEQQQQQGEQQQQPDTKHSSKQQQQTQANSTAVAGGAAAAAVGGDSGSDDEPAFWEPDGENSQLSERSFGSDDQAGSQSDSDAAAAAGGSDEAIDEADQPGPAEVMDPMEEDPPQYSNQGTAAAATAIQRKGSGATAAAATAIQRNGSGMSGSSNGSKQKLKQRAAEAVANGVAAGGGGGKKKQNVGRPRSAKKTKR